MSRLHLSKFRFFNRLFVMLFIMIAYLGVSIIGADVFAVPQTINVQDGSVSDWGGVAAFNDSYGDVNGSGPNDLVKLWVTSDSANMYCRWDVILSGNKALATSVTYSLAVNSQSSTGTTRPSAEARAYVTIDQKGVVSSVAIANASKTVTLDPATTYAEQISTGITKTLVSIEAKFPFSTFNDNLLTTNPLGPTSLFPLWGESLASGASPFTSAVKDTIPDIGYLNYDATNAVCIPKGTGPVADLSISTTNNYNLMPGATAYYVITIKNVGDNTGNPNLLFNQITWTLPAGFTYISGSTTGLTTSNPTGTTGTVTWPISNGTLAPGSETNLYFRATASNTAGAYYSDATVTATTPAITYDTGDGAVINVDAKYVVPGIPTLSVTGTTQTSASLSWTSASNAASYNIYDNGVLIASNVTGTTFTVNNLSPGSTHPYQIRSVSSYDVKSDMSNTANATTVAPYVVTVNNLTTNNNKPAITGTTNAPNGSAISILIGGKTYTGTVSGGLWSVNVTDTLVDNTYTVSASITSAISNTASGTVIIDTVAPGITINSISTNVQTPTITGTTNAANGSTVTLTINSKQYTGLASNGAWSINVTDILPYSSYPASASVSDTAGNTGTANGTVTISQLSSNANLINLATNAGSVSPTFDSSVTSYSLNVSSNTTSITITPTAEDSKSSIKVNGTTVTSGTASGAISLNAGANSIVIEVTAEDGTKKLYNLTVNRAVNATGVSLDKDTVSIYQFEQTTLVATISPEDATDKTVTWSSNDESVATVDSNGKVTGVAPGTAVITVTAHDGGSTDICAITVNKPEVTVTLDGSNNLKINIRGWNSSYSYQIWTYQTVTSDILLDASSNVKVNQWVLSNPYASALSATQEPDGSISYVISLPPETPEGNYVVSIKIKDGDGNYIGELKDTYTPTDIGVVMISKVLVDGEATYSNETKEIKPGAAVALEIDALNANNYSLAVNGTTQAQYSTNNKFTWNIADLQPGAYTLVFYAKNTTTGSIYSKTVFFTLFTRTNTNYGIINDMDVTGNIVNSSYTVSLNPQLVNGDYFYYTIGEPGRSPFYSSDMLPKQSSYSTVINKYGIYDVYGYIKRAGSNTYDDGIVRTVKNARSGNASIDLIIDNVNMLNTPAVSKAKNVKIVLNANATIGNLNPSDIQYSYWRYDAKGYVLIKDWSSQSSLNWTPARPGSYTIQVRAKGVDAGSYEVSKSITVDVSKSEIVPDASISINSDYLNANATARVPITINADASASNNDPLLYKFYVYDSNLGTSTLQQFSPIQSCQWTPRKAGNYIITVLVKNEKSFGRYDISKSFNITVK